MPIRTLAGVALGVVLLSGCGVLSGNSGEVCASVTAEYRRYAAELEQAPAADEGKWRQATERFAGRVDALAKKADDPQLTDALRKQTARLRAAATGLGEGDVAELDAVLRDAPAKIGAVCDG
ncbi:hypothetical protein BJF79_33745 [Actinomadura sp. CNU-125]|uniref:hypothetical protein n=1 Tax=Actinomadura sp. CNU-125 TaxID=1904961 RepID=UPI00095E95DA|nr:hypothetical protein [Actinomadura sp. CNU-125]OLT34140.1 hypothetical protein BJF79_33745 [Actinomadura sp. CNU-125]